MAVALSLPGPDAVGVIAHRRGQLERRLAQRDEKLVVRVARRAAARPAAQHAGLGQASVDQPVDVLLAQAETARHRGVAAQLHEGRDDLVLAPLDRRQVAAFRHRHDGDVVLQQQLPHALLRDAEMPRDLHVAVTAAVERGDRRSTAPGAAHHVVLRDRLHMDTV